MSDKTRNLLILGGILLALIGVGIAAAFKPVVLGLDLQGGLEVTLQAAPKKGQTLQPGDLDRTLTIIRNRVDSLGVSEPDIRKEGTNRITVALAGVKDPAKAAKVIGTTGALYLTPFQSGLEKGVSLGSANGQPVATSTLYYLLRASRGRPPSTGTQPWSQQWYAFDAKTKKRIADAKGQPLGPWNTKAQAEAAVKARFGGKLPKGVAFLSNPTGTLAASCDTTRGCIGTKTGQAGTVWYLFRYPKDPNLVLNGREVSSAKADIDTQGRGNVVNIQFHSKGNKQFKDITALLAREGKTQEALNGSPPTTPGQPPPYVRNFAVILDGKLQSTPYVDYQQFPNGIDPSNGGAQISNIGSFSEAKDIALVLQSGALPVPFVPIQSTSVSATLGQASLHQGLIAGIAGLIAVMIYLIVVYRFLGVVADLALLIYAAFMYGVIVLIPITMTLPGIAGIVLTIGVAADANVVIFERIKEEVRLGKSVRAAINSGYTKGFRTIVDANVVTLITAGVLFIAGTGTVKGFAFTLGLGVIVSTITAVFATRAMLHVLASFRWFHNASFMGASANKVRWRIDIIGRKNLWFAISGAVVLIGLGSLAVRGLNLGIDFKGGTRITAGFQRPATVSEVRNYVIRFENKDPNPVVVGTGSALAGQRYKGFQIQTKTLTPPQVATLQTALDKRFHLVKPSAQSVSASLGSEILKSALLAVFFSLLLIVGYVSFRFEFKYALPMIAALVHDVLITLGVYSITGREVTSATVAAVLTVLGYSLYDTIIIFDRVRENTPLLRKNTYSQIVNVSLWETLTRSLNTSLITLVPIASLLIFGGSTLKDFAFALLIGIASGAYSSLFIAAPLLAVWKEAEPEYRNRKRTASVPVQKATLGTVDTTAREERALAGAGAREASAAGAASDGDQNGAAAAPVAATAPAPPSDDGLSDAERAAREAARQRRLERRRNRPHGRAR